jgi:hypothetical protein
MYVNGVNVSAHVQVYDSEFRAHFLQYPPWEYSEFHVRFDSLVPFLRLALFNPYFLTGKWTSQPHVRVLTSWLGSITGHVGISPVQRCYVRNAIVELALSAEV